MVRMWWARLFRNETTDMVSHRPTLQKNMHPLPIFPGLEVCIKLLCFQSFILFACFLYHAFGILIQTGNQYSVCWRPDAFLRSSRSFICYSVPGNLWHLPATQDRVILHYPTTWWRYQRPRCLSHKQDLHAPHNRFIHLHSNGTGP